MERQHLAPLGCQPCRQPPGEIFLEREDRFRLRAIALDDDRAGLGDVGERLIEDLGTDAASEGFGTDGGEKLLERGPGRLGLRGRGRLQQQGCQDRRRESAHATHGNSLTAGRPDHAAPGRSWPESSACLSRRHEAHEIHEDPDG